MDSTTILGRIEAQRPSKPRLTSDRILARFEKPVGDMSLAASVRREQLRRRIQRLQVDAATPKFGCLMAMIPSLDASLPNYAVRLIPNEALTGDGIETEPHVTIFYGFNDGFDSKRLEEFCKPYFPMEMTVGKVSRFECPDHDVIKFEIESPEFAELHAAIAQEFSADITPSKWPYTPHMTIAYVQKGARLNGIRDGGRNGITGQKFIITSLLYSMPEKQGRHVIKAAEPTDHTAEQDLPQPPEGHREARDLATPFYQHAINRLVAAAEIQQLQAKEKDGARRKKKREEELMLLWLLLMQDAAAAAYCATGNALGALLPETGMQSNTVTEAEADAFAEARAPLIRDIPENIIGKLEKATESLPPATTPQQRRKVIKEAAQEIEQTYGDAVAENEAHATYCGAQIEMLRKAGYETKKWVTCDDDLVRKTHVDCGQQEPIPMEARFSNGLLYPHEPDAPPEETVNCRCWLVGSLRKTEKKI